MHIIIILTHKQSVINKWISEILMQFVIHILKAVVISYWKMQDQVEIITNHMLQFWTKIPKYVCWQINPRSYGNVSYLPKSYFMIFKCKYVCKSSCNNFFWFNISACCSSLTLRAVIDHMTCYNLNWLKIKLWVHYFVFSCALGHILKS